jgi:hypothetical protein
MNVLGILDIDIFLLIDCHLIVQARHCDPGRSA